MLQTVFFPFLDRNVIKTTSVKYVTRKCPNSFSYNKKVYDEFIVISIHRELTAIFLSCLAHNNYIELVIPFPENLIIKSFGKQKYGSTGLMQAKIKSPLPSPTSFR